MSYKWSAKCHLQIILLIRNWFASQPGLPAPVGVPQLPRGIIVGKGKAWANNTLLSSYEHAWYIFRNLTQAVVQGGLLRVSNLFYPAQPDFFSPIGFQVSLCHRCLRSDSPDDGREHSSMHGFPLTPTNARPWTWFCPAVTDNQVQMYWLTILCLVTRKRMSDQENQCPWFLHLRWVCQMGGFQKETHFIIPKLHLDLQDNKAEGSRAHLPERKGEGSQLSSPKGIHQLHLGLHGSRSKNQRVRNPHPASLLVLSF